MAKTPRNKKAGKNKTARRLKSAIYKKPIRATRRGPLFNAFPYPTKISPETIALFIATHTKPGQSVLDCFSGSGTTGLAAILCARPTAEMKREAEKLKIPVRWGPRRAVLYEIGILGSFIARVLCSPPDPDLFKQAAETIISEAEIKSKWLYGAQSPGQKPGAIRYIIWSDILKCTSCKKQTSLWDACVSRKPANISEKFTCPECNYKAALDNVSRIAKNFHDDLLNQDRKTRYRQPLWVYGTADGRNWNRPAQDSDLKLLRRIEKEALPDSVPKIAIPWGDLYRSGYHEGITHLHHFYTRRNLIAFSRLWEQVQEQPPELKDALRFWLLSYNASHATIMTRVVAKKGINDLVVTSAQPGVMYVSGLPVEKNIFEGLRRKLNTITKAFRITRGNKSTVEIHNASSTKTNLKDESIDYLFTDPPFGGNIPYAEVNFLNEAWLGTTTDATEEAIISPHQSKSVDDYQEILQQVFQEAYRVLKPKAKATVVFHSSSAKVWNALRTACEEAGFTVNRTSVLDKTQGSFKQVTTNGSVKGDPLILLSKDKKFKKTNPSNIWAVVEKLVRQAESSRDPAEKSPQRIYSRLVSHYLVTKQEVPISASKFYKQFESRRNWT